MDVFTFNVVVCVHITFILFNPIQYSKLNYVDEYK